VRSRTPAIVFGSFLVLVWATRIRNALGDDQASTGRIAFSVTVACLFTIGGLAILLTALRRSSHLDTVVRAVAAVTVVYWPIRVVQIALADHSAGFVAVHAVLGALSVALALWAWPRPRVRSAPSLGKAAGRVRV
jgi:exosortase/archaeosortase